MAEQFINSNEQKVEDETAKGKPGDKQVDRIAEKAAEKASKTVQENEKNQPIFSK